MTPGTYKRTGWQRRKASKAMKKVWAKRRKSAAMKALIAERKAKGLCHTNGGSYRDNTVTEMHKAGLITPKTLIGRMFGPNVGFNDLTTEQRRQYWAATDKRRRTVKSIPMQKISDMIDNAHKVRIESKPQELIIRISVEGNVAELKDIRLSPSQTA